MTYLEIVDALDKAYNATEGKLGSYHTKNALKYLLLGDKTALDDNEPIKDPYNYISNKYEGRDLIKQIKKTDIMQMLIQFCVFYNSIVIDIQINKLIESIKNDIETTFLEFSINKEFYGLIYVIFINCRYKKAMKEEMDNFIISNQLCTKIESYKNSINN